MKKHIIIAGVPRSGKSTLSQRISDRLGYQHISMDAIIAGIERVFPETGINSDADTDLLENIQYISAKMALFIRAMTDSGEYNECDYGMVIDIFQLLPQHYMQHIDTLVCDIYYFGTSDVTPEERYALLREYDTPRDYTYYKSEEENREDCASIVTISNYLKEQCRIYKLPYYDTSYDREQLFQHVVDKIRRP
ncbi:MAG: ATP-binding protein [Lachnospiraceae bacterium]|nr:ATP-binding protein [Lachnospiraceae bacterium]MDE7275047.1 ATP-binding protein [Lachnospiraceae bacterium]